MPSLSEAINQGFGLETSAVAVFNVTEAALAIGTRMVALVREGRGKEIGSLLKEDSIKMNLNVMEDYIDEIYTGFFTYRTNESDVFLDSILPSAFVPKHSHSHAEGDSGCRWTLLSSRDRSQFHSFQEEFPLNLTMNAPGSYPLNFVLSCTTCGERFLQIFCSRNPGDLAEPGDLLDKRPTRPEYTAYESAGHYWISGPVAVATSGFFDRDAVPNTFNKFSESWTFRRGA